MSRIAAAMALVAVTAAPAAALSTTNVPTESLVVKRGDTLSALFKDTPGGWSRAAYVNGITNPDVIVAGMVLRVPERDGKRWTPPRRVAVVSRSSTPQTSAGEGGCGGSLPSCAILECESGGDIHAENPTSSASGKWQVLDSTWDGYRGYARASDAPEWVQDEFARKLWNGGAGRSQWAC